MRIRIYFLCTGYIIYLQQKSNSQSLELSCVSLTIGTNGKPLAAIGEFPSATGKLMISKTLAAIVEEITNAMIGNDELAIYW